MLYMINELDVWRDIEGYTINDVIKDVTRIELNNPYNVRESIAKSTTILHVEKWEIHDKY